MEIPSWVKKLSRTTPLCCFLVVLLSMAVTAMGNTVLDAKAKDGFVIASINASEPNITAICVSYDSHGKMVAVSTEKLEQGNHTYYFDVWAVSYQTVKIFLTDEKNTPLCNAVYVPEDDPVVQSQGYALIRWIESEYYDPRDNNQAQLLFSNGTQRTVDLYRDYLAGWFGSTLTNEEYHDYSYGNRKFVVHYTILSDGTYRLARMTDRYCTVAPSDFYIANREICNWSDVAGRVDSNTEFIVNDDGTYRLSKIQNMPNIRGNVEAYAYIGSDGYAKYVWIINADFIIRTVITFVASASCSDEIVTGDQWDETYHSYNAVVNGTIKTIQVAKYTSLFNWANNRLHTLNGSEYEELKETVTIPQGGGTHTGGGGGGSSIKYSIIGDVGSTLPPKPNPTQLTVDGSAESKSARNSVIFNCWTVNSSETIISGYYRNSDISVYRAHGVEAASDGKILVNTAHVYDAEWTNVPENSYRYFLSNTDYVNAYYVDRDGNIIHLPSVYDIQTDSNAWVFFTEGEDNRVTNIFVCADNTT